SDRRRDQVDAPAGITVAPSDRTASSEMKTTPLTRKTRHDEQRSRFLLGIRKAVSSVRSIGAPVSRVLPLLVTAATLFGAAPVSAQMTGAPTAGYRQEPGAVASSVPAPLREIGFDQHLDQALPLDAPFFDERGQTVRLGQYFGSKPVVLAFVYYTCPMLCMQVLNATASTLDVLPLDAGPAVLGV